MSYSAILSSPIGPLGIILKNDSLTELHFLSQKTLLIPPQNKFAEQISLELQHYFANPTHVFSLKFATQGTSFQEAVWNTLLKIKSGETFTYGDLAKKLKTSPRAIGNACRTNKIPLIIPCHRIVAKNNLGGFLGETKETGIQIKKWLLQHESFTDKS